MENLLNVYSVRGRNRQLYIKDVEFYIQVINALFNIDYSQEWALRSSKSYVCYLFNLSNCLALIRLQV